MDQELIDQIQEIVVRVLQEQTTKPAHVPTPEKRLLAILGATQTELEEPTQQLKCCAENGWKITIILSELATKTLNLDPIYRTFGEGNILEENRLTDIPAFVARYRQLVLPALAYPMAAKLALSLVDTPATYAVFEALTQGKKVIAAKAITDTGTHQQRTVSGKTGTLFRHLENDYVNLLSELNVQLVATTDIAAVVGADENGSRAIVTETLISTTTLSNLAADVRELMYPNTTIITPLAREHAKKRGIRLIPKD